MAEKLTKQQRLDQARADAKAQREARERRSRMLRWLVPSVSAVAIVLVVVIVVVVIAVQPKSTPASAAGPVNMLSDGVAFEGSNGQLSVVKTAGLAKGAKPVATQWPAGDTRKHLLVVTDLGCPYCKLFEQKQGENVLDLVKSGKATIEIHPINFIHYEANGDGSDYSTRAANAMAMIASVDPAKFFDAYSALYDQQPSETGSGLTNDDIISVLHSAGVNEQRIDDGIRAGTYSKWVMAASARALDEPRYRPSGATKFAGTPSVFVDGSYLNFTSTDYTDVITALS